MIRSLRFKWSLTLIITSLVGIVLVGVLATQINVSEYQRFRDAEFESVFAEIATEYYTQSGTWDGLSDEVFSNSFRQQFQKPDPEKDPEKDRKEQQTPIVVADMDGRVVKPFGEYEMGEIVSAGELEKGNPIIVDGEQVGTIVSTAPPEFDESELLYLQRTNSILLIGAGVAVAVAVLLGSFLSRQFLRPLAELTFAIENVKQGKFDQRVPVRSDDELGELARTFNQMGEELQRVNKLRRQMTADIAHDLRTPLTVIAGYLEGLRDGSLQPTQSRFDTLYQESQLLKRLIEDLRTLSLADAGELNLMYQPVHPRDLLEQVIVSFTPLAESQQVIFKIDAQDDLPMVDMDRDRMVQVLGNLISNALRFTPEGGTITLSAATTTDEVILKVSDTGSGISPEHLQNIFARFYRASESREQQHNESGLGLAIAKSIITAHEGEITAESTLGQGTTIILTIPRHVE